jgi:hypothetical protein
MKYKSGIRACVLIALGAIFLLSNFGLLPHLFMKQWWPLILIFVGIFCLIRRCEPKNSE